VDSTTVKAESGSRRILAGLHGSAAAALVPSASATRATAQRVDSIALISDSSMAAP